MTTLDTKVGESCSARIQLSLIVAAAFAVRVAAALIFWRPGAIAGEGAEYARIAENLRHGLGYVGIVTPGPELMFPPLFPLLIAAFSFFTHDYEWAGRWVGILLGSALPLPMYGIALRLFNRRAALVAALIAACHPLFINLSISVLSEGPYITLLLSAIYLVLRALDQATIKNWCFVGAAFGLAFAIRQESLAPMFIAAFLALVAIAGTRVSRFKCSVAAVVTFLVFISPDIFVLYKNTGHLRLEGKSAVNFAIGSRMLAGQDPNQAGYAINQKLEGTGVWMCSNATVIRETRTSIKTLMRVGVKGMSLNVPNLFYQVSERWLGSPLLPALALLGLFRRPWRRATIPHHLFVLLVPATAILATFTVVHGVFPRNYFVLVPFLSIWAANGVVAVVNWTKSTVNAAALGMFQHVALWSSFAALAATVLAGLVVTGIHVRNDPGLNDESVINRDIKEVGLWIGHQQDRRVKIMDLWTPVAFHADADYVHFPYASAADTIRFLDSAGVDYIVLRRGSTFTDYYDDWLNHGIPDPRAQLVYTSSGASPFIVFRWRKSDGRNEELPSPRIEGTMLLPEPTHGPLHVDPLNPRYFVDSRNKAVLLAGSHTWGNLQDSGRMSLAAFDYDANLDFLAANGHNFMRLWAWEQANWAPWRPYDWLISPVVYKRTGPGLALDGKPRFDLEQFDPDYFTRLRARVAKAGLKGIYVSVMLFNRFSIQRKEGRPFPFGDPWRGHPFNHANNTNDVDGDRDGAGNGLENHRTPDVRILALQERYVAAVIDAVGNLDNVLYEICNEDEPGSEVWQSHMVEFIRRYEARKGARHPVGMSAEYPNGKNNALFSGPADWVSPNRDGGYDVAPPPAKGDKVIVADTDHIWGIGGDRSWVWKSITRGLNILLMDPYDNEWMFPPRPESEASHWSELRRAIGYARSYVEQLDLAALVPHGELASTGYCLADLVHGVYLVYAPLSHQTVAVSTNASSGTLKAEWLEPATGKISRAPDATVGSPVRLVSPYPEDSVLLLRAF